MLPSPRLSSRASLSHSGVLKIGAQGNARSLSPAVSPRANLEQSGAMFVLSLFELCSNFSQALRGPFLVVSTPNFGNESAYLSIVRYLQDMHPFAALQFQNLGKSSPFSISLLEFLFSPLAKIVNMFGHRRC